MLLQNKTMLLHSMTLQPSEHQGLLQLTQDLTVPHAGKSKLRTLTNPDLLVNTCKLLIHRTRKTDTAIHYYPQQC